MWRNWLVEAGNVAVIDDKGAIRGLVCDGQLARGRGHGAVRLIGQGRKDVESY